MFRLPRLGETASLLALVALAIVSALFFPHHVLATDCSGAYSRNCYPHWIDADGDGENTRQEILALDSLIPVTRNEEGNIVAGLWLSHYDGVIHYSPRTLDLDHIIALGHVHRIGGREMTPEQRVAIANDPLNLVLVTAGSNRQKSDHSASRWMIANLAWLEEFLDRQHAVRIKYGLSFESCEQKAIRFQRWLAERTAKGVRVYRIDRYADDVARLLSDGTILALYKSWQACQEEVE